MKPLLEKQAGGEKKSALMEREAAEAWLGENPDAWRLMLNFALSETAHERRFSLQHCAEKVRSVDLVDVHGQPTRINNNLCAALARIMVERHPETAPYVVRRKSRSDAAFGGGAR